MKSVRYQARNVVLEAFDEYGNLGKGQGREQRRRWFEMLLVLFVVLFAVKPLQACDPFIEESSDHVSATFRAHTTVFANCPVSEATYRQVVASWLATRDAKLPQPNSLGLGRAISFPWISRFFVDTALAMPVWQSTAGTRPRHEWDSVAATIIRRPELRARLGAPFADSRIQVDGVVFEKVLYGPAQQHGASGEGAGRVVPFDAQLWLRLGPRN